MISYDEEDLKLARRVITQITRPGPLLPDSEVRTDFAKYSITIVNSKTWFRAIISLRSGIVVFDRRIDLLPPTIPDSLSRNSILFACMIKEVDSFGKTMT